MFVYSCFSNCLQLKYLFLLPCRFQEIGKNIDPNSDCLGKCIDILKSNSIEGFKVGKSKVSNF